MGHPIQADFLISPADDLGSRSALVCGQAFLSPLPNREAVPLEESTITPYG